VEVTEVNFKCLFVYFLSEEIFLRQAGDQKLHLFIEKVQSEQAILLSVLWKLA